MEERELRFVTPNFGKIFAAKGFDILSLVVLTAALLFASFSIMHSSSSYKNDLAEREEIALRSKLYRKSNDSLVRLDEALQKDSELTYDQKSEVLSEANEYYLLQSTGSGETYSGILSSAEIEGTKMFSDSGERVLNNDDYDDDYYAFHQKVYENEALPRLAKDPEYRHARNRLILNNVIAVAATLAFSHLLLNLVIPFFFVGRKTLGMLLVKIGYVDERGFSPKWWRHTLHALFRLVFILFGSLAAFLIPLAISITFLIVRKDRASLADYLFKIHMVESDSSRIYRDEKAFLDAVIQEEN